MTPQAENTPNRPARVRRPGVLRFATDRRGVTAVEFGMIAAPFFGLIFAIVQSSFAFLIQQGLRASLDHAARQVFTGQVQNNAAVNSPTTFRDALICGNAILPSFVTCADVVVDVRPASSFSALGADSVDSSFMSDGKGPEYKPGQPCDIMVVRAAYPMPSYLPLITWGPGYSLITNLTGLTTYKGQLVQMLTAAAVFRNEPFVSPSGLPSSSCST